VPILFVKVLVDAEAGKSYLNVFKLELTGSRVAEIANGTFNGQLLFRAIRSNARPTAYVCACVSAR
jgi:hypothetical protein